MAGILQEALWIHFEISRQVLEKEKIVDSTATDILTRQFLEHCQKLFHAIKYPVSLKKLLEECKSETEKVEKEGRAEDIITKPSVEILQLVKSEDDFERDFEKNGLFLWDWFYIKTLASIGKAGKTASKKITTKLKRNFKDFYKSGEKNKLFDFWFIETDDESKTHFFYSPAFKILCQTIWNDLSKDKLALEKKSYPSVPKAVWVSTIKPPLSKNTRVESDDTSVTCYSEDGGLVASVPCVEPKLVNLIKKGMAKFSSLTGHKLLRWEVKSGFQNWIQDQEDPRLICVPGGYEYIAKLIGCGKSNKAPADVKSILHAQTYGRFQFPDGSQGNMIIHREVDRYRNGEPSKINIILGELILPDYTHLLPKGEKRRLIPITELPPLIGSKNTHAAQAMLQLLILEEFSNQSKDLAEKGCIYLPNEKLDELAAEASLPKSRIQDVISGWTEDDLFSKAFLQKQGDEYTLGESYSQVVDFLEDQGNKRIVAQVRRQSCKNSKNHLNFMFLNT